MNGDQTSILAGSNILVVDDTPANLALLSNMLNERGCKVRPVTSGKLALKVIENEAPDLILLDINMPEMDGYEVCRRVKADPRFDEIPVIFISALSDTAEKIEAFRNGGVDYITKPFRFEEVEARVKTHLKLHHYQVYLEQIIREKVQEISNSQISTIFALARLAESRDNDTGRHLERVQLFCRILAENICPDNSATPRRCSEYINDISNASSLHDIGKVAISDNILLKPGKLTQDEFELVKQHTIIGAQTLDEVKQVYPGNSFINMGILIARSHHEHWDGSGYPDGLAGEDIPLAARIMAVVDVYDALRSRRCYKEPFSRQQSGAFILNGSGRQFDPAVVRVFNQVEGEINRIGMQMGFM